MKEQLALEYIKYVRNPTYLIESHFKTMDLTQHGYVPFKLFPRQKDIISALHNHRHNLITKPRQAGISTTVAAFVASKAATADPNKPEKIMIIANKAVLAQEFMSKIKNFLRQVPTWVWGEYYDHNKETDGHVVGKGSVKKITLLNGTEIYAVATSTDALRGYTPTYLVVDEAAFIDNGRELYNAAMSSLITGGRMILISTPNGLDELYYRTYAGAIEDPEKHPFNIVELKWYQDPRYNKDLEWVKYSDTGEVEEKIKEKDFNLDQFEEMIKEGYKPTSSWYREMCASLQFDKKAIARELDVKFEGSAGNVIEYKSIEYILENTTESPIREEWEDKLMWIWEDPIEGHEYILGSDVSTGDGEDYSSVKIINLTTMEEAAEYKGKIRPERLAALIEHYGYLYNAYTVIDTTGGYGDTTVYELEQREYKLLHYSETGDDVLKTEAINKQNKSEVDKTRVAGYRVGTAARRTRLISKYVSIIEANELKVKSVRHANEMKTYVWKNGRADHMRGFNDDIIFATGLALWIAATHFKKIKRAKEISTAMLQNWNGLNINQSDIEKRKRIMQKNKKTKHLYKSTQDPTGEYSWLFR